MKSMDNNQNLYNTEIDDITRPKLQIPSISITNITQKLMDHEVNNNNSSLLLVLLI